MLVGFGLGHFVHLEGVEKKECVLHCSSLLSVLRAHRSQDQPTAWRAVTVLTHESLPCRAEG